jgi:hypothetical protein
MNSVHRSVLTLGVCVSSMSHTEPLVGYVNVTMAGVALSVISSAPLVDAVNTESVLMRSVTVIEGGMGIAVTSKGVLTIAPGMENVISRYCLVLPCFSLSLPPSALLYVNALFCFTSHHTIYTHTPYINTTDNSMQVHPWVSR